jgi:hypothetical protein
MKQQEPRDTFRLDDHPRNIRKDIALAATALAVVGVFALAAGDGLSAANVPASIAVPAAAQDAECGPLWDRVRVLGLPEASWDTAATALGLTARGEWISVDGLIWEHRDGSTVEVANPRSDVPRGTSDCAEGVDENETSDA